MAFRSRPRNWCCGKSAAGRIEIRCLPLSGFREAADRLGMTGLLIAIAAGAGALLCLRHIVQPLGRVLELCDDLVEREGRLFTRGGAPHVLAFCPAERPYSSVRDVAAAQSPPPG